MSNAYSNAVLPNVSIKMEYELEGKEVVFEGTARMVEMDTQVEYDDVRSIYDSSVSSLYHDAHTTKLKADLLDGWKITTYEPVVREVNMIARVSVENRTVDDFEKARVQVGAPKSAQMKFFPDLRNITEGIILEPLDSPEGCTVEFTWKKKVRKTNG